MTMKVGVFTGYLAVLPVFVLAGIFHREIQAVKKSALDNQLFSGYVLDHIQGVTTVFRCQAVCLQNIWCDSFFFNKQTALCQTNNKVFGGSETWTINIGMKYYVLQRVKESVPDLTNGIYSQRLGVKLGISVSKVDWKTAEYICQVHSGQLISIDTQDKFNFVEEIIKSYRGLDREGVLYFVGASDKITENVWLWQNGAVLPTDSPLWCNGQPDNGPLFFQQNYCAMWNSRECRLKLDDVSFIQFGYALCDLPYT